MRSTLSSKGQVTIPVAIRVRLGLQAGTPVEFEIQGEVAVIRKGRTGDHPIDRGWRHIDLGKPVDEIIDELRGPRPKPL